MRMLAIAALAAALGSAAAAANPAPALRLVRTKPLVVAGSHFRAAERVTVIATTTRPFVRHTVARHGSFTVRLDGMPLSRCLGLRVVAVGSLGSRAVLHLPRPACMPVPLPATGTGRTP